MFYPRFVQLCEQKDVKKTRALLDAGLPKSAAKYWEEAYNKGIDSKPTTQNAVKLANYFGVTVDYLLNAEKENPTAQGDGVDTITEKEVRMLKWFRSLPEEKRRAILISQDAPKDLLD